MNRTMPCDRSSVSAWETFTFLTEADYAALQHLLHHDWVSSSTRRVVRQQQIAFREGFILELGELRLDLRYNLPLIGHTPSGSGVPAQALSYSVLADNWRLVRLHLFRPLVVIAAFGPPELAGQVAALVSSLLEFGRYEGNIHIITDLDETTLITRLSALDAERLSIQKLQSKGGAKFARGRYAIVDHADATSYQPLLMLDPDFVCDASIEPLLATAATLDRISTIPVPTNRRQSSAVNNELLDQGGYSPWLVNNVDQGLLVVPNLHNHAEILEITRTIATNLSEIAGEGRQSDLDQDVIDYIAYTAGQFDTQSLAPFVRHAGPGGNPDATNPYGLLHFAADRSGTSAEGRMQSYLTSVRELQRQ